MATYEISDAARQDLDEIWDYVAADRLQAADGLINDLIAAIEVIALLPASGRKRYRLMRGVRQYPCGNYLIFYTTSARGVRIVRVLHGSRLITRRLFT